MVRNAIRSATRRARVSCKSKTFITNANSVLSAQRSAPRLEVEPSTAVGETQSVYPLCLNQVRQRVIKMHWPDGYVRRCILPLATSDTLVLQLIASVNSSSGATRLNTLYRLIHKVIPHTSPAAIPDIITFYTQALSATASKPSPATKTASTRSAAASRVTSRTLRTTRTRSCCA